MRNSVGQSEEVHSPAIQEAPELWDGFSSRPSPDMRPSLLLILFGTPRKFASNYV